MWIVLTEAQADQVRGPTANRGYLDPVALASGTEWVLPVRVLDDDDHAQHHTFLSGLPQRAVLDSEWPDDGGIE